MKVSRKQLMNMPKIDIPSFVPTRIMGTPGA